MSAVEVQDSKSDIITFWFFLQLCCTILFCVGCGVTLLDRDASFGSEFFVCCLMNAAAVHVLGFDVDAGVLGRVSCTEVFVSWMGQ